MRLLGLFLLLTAAVFPQTNRLPESSGAPATVHQLLEQKLLHRIADYDQRLGGALGVAVLDLSDGQFIGYHAQTQFPTASVIKIYILYLAYRQRQLGQLNFAESVTLAPADVVGGSGALAERLKQGPLTLPVSEIIREMIVSSDNTATNWLIRRLGMESINKAIQELGLSRTRLNRIMLDQAAATRNAENISTPAELVETLRLFHHHTVIGPAASEEMLNTMKQVKADIRAVIPAGIDVASKPGDLTGVRSEVAVVYLKKRPYAVAIMSSFLKEPNSPIQDIARLVFEHFQTLESGNVYGNLGVR